MDSKAFAQKKKEVHPQHPNKHSRAHRIGFIEKAI